MNELEQQAITAQQHAESVRQRKALATQQAFLQAFNTGNTINAINRSRQ